VDHLKFFASCLIGLGLLLGCPGGAAFAQSDEIVFWNSVKDSKDGAEFCAYLETYPDGKFKALAKLRAKKLGGDCGSGKASGDVRFVKPTGENLAASELEKRKDAKNRKHRFTRTGWLTRKDDIAETFRMSNQGVTIKWKGGTCTRFKLSSASESLPDYGVIQKSHPLHDNHGSTGIWGIRKQLDPASRYDNFCIRFSKWKHFNCHAMRVEGPLLHYYSPQGDEHRGSGVLMYGDAFEECKSSSFEELLAKARKPAARKAAARGADTDAKKKRANDLARQAIAAVEIADYKAAGHFYNGILELGIRVPDAFYYYFGLNQVRAKRFDEAKRLLTRYKERAGSHGKFAGEADALLKRIAFLRSADGKAHLEGLYGAYDPGPSLSWAEKRVGDREGDDWYSFLRVTFTPTCYLSVNFTLSEPPRPVSDQNCKKRRRLTIYSMSAKLTAASARDMLPLEETGCTALAKDSFAKKICGLRLPSAFDFSNRSDSECLDDKHNEQPAHRIYGKSSDQLIKMRGMRKHLIWVEGDIYEEIKDQFSGYIRRCAKLQEALGQ